MRRPLGRRKDDHLDRAGARLAGRGYEALLARDTLPKPTFVSAAGRAPGTAVRLFIDAGGRLPELLVTRTGRRAAVRRLRQELAARGASQLLVPDRGAINELYVRVTKPETAISDRLLSRVTTEGSASASGRPYVVLDNTDRVGIEALAEDVVALGVTWSDALGTA